MDAKIGRMETHRQEETLTWALRPRSSYWTLEERVDKNKENQKTKQNQMLTGAQQPIGKNSRWTPRLWKRTNEENWKWINTSHCFLNL